MPPIPRPRSCLRGLPPPPRTIAPSPWEAHRNKDGFFRRGQDFCADEPRVAEEELADLVALDRASRREVILHDQSARRRCGEDLLPVERTAAVGEDELERAALAQHLVD